MLAKRSLTGWIDSERMRRTMPSSAATSSGDGACGAGTRPDAAPSPFGPLGGAAEAGATGGVAARLAADDLSQSGVRTLDAGARTPGVACGPLLAEAAEVAAADVPAVGDAMATGVVGSAKRSLEGGCDAAAESKSPFAPAAGAPKGGGSLAAGGSGGGGEGRGELAPGLCCALVRGDFAMGCSCTAAESCSTTLLWRGRSSASTLPSFSRAASSAVRPFCVLSDASAPDESRSGTQSSHPSDAA
mmetsp:Transcript_40733/g.131899  ORF Transcript_40733/g.131899 Transcript_40733/m.131899 type:complete len:245 (-) Transcript_40733:1557-2291(-)